MGVKETNEIVEIDQGDFEIRVFKNKHYGTFYSPFWDEDGPFCGYLWFSYQKSNGYNLEDFDGRHTLPEELLDILVEHNLCSKEAQKEFLDYVRPLRF